MSRGAQGRQFCKGAKMSQVLITGATGLVGGHLLRMLINEPKVNAIAAPTRRPLGDMPGVFNPHDPQLTDALAQVTDPIDIVFCCLGTTRREAGSKEAFIHAGAANHVKVKLQYVNSEKLTEDTIEAVLKPMCGILVAPGFGHRGIEGKIMAVKYAREHRIPVLGICVGMQCCVIEFARNVLGYRDANSTEMEPNTTHKVIDLMEEQKNITNMGGSMRLGAYDCVLKKGSKVYEAYKTEHIQERHRHRFEFNNDYKQQFESAGMMCTGENPDTNLVEVVEIPSLKWFVGVQYHPEYNSTVLNPNPLFLSFVKAAIDNKEK